MRTSFFDNFQFPDVLANKVVLGSAEAVEGFSHEVIANAQAGQGAFEAFDAGGLVGANGVNGLGQAHHLLV